MKPIHKRPAGRSTDKRDLLQRASAPIVLFAIVIGLWQGACVYWQIGKYLLPRPTQVLEAARENGGELASATWLTAEAALAGFAISLIVGVLLAMLFSQSRLVERSIFPYVVFLQTVPIVAIAPIIVTWLGYGFRSVAIVSFIISLFPIIAGATTGLTLIDAALLELFAMHNATRWQTLWKLRLPHAVPYLVTAAKTSCGLAVIGAIVGEFFVGTSTNSHALGYIITMATAQSKMDLLFAAVSCSTLLGVGLFAAVNGIGAVVLRRWRVAPRRQTMERIGSDK